ncbi:tetratricopeptide repeat protein [Planctomycetota bacterium]
MDAVVVRTPAASPKPDLPQEPSRTTYADADPASVTREEAKAFIGPNAAYYLDRWAQALDGRGRTIGFNAGAFWLTGLWLPYRKLYSLALVYYAILAVAAGLEQLLTAGQEGGSNTVGMVVGLVGGLVFGSYGNRWYLSRARNVVAQVRAQDLPDDEHLETLASRGGTSFLRALAMLALFYVLMMGAIGSVDFWNGLFHEATRPAPSMLTFNNGEVYYSDAIGEQQARKLGKYLVDTGFFDGTPVTTSITKTDEAFEFRFVTRKGVENDSQALEFLRQYGTALSRDVFGGERVDIHLCDAYMNQVKVIRGTKTKPSTYTFGAGGTERGPPTTGSMSPSARKALRLYQRGVDHLGKGEFDEAIADLTEAVRLDPDFALAYVCRGSALREKRLYDSATADCDKAISLAPDLALAYYVRGPTRSTPGTT